MLPSVKSLKLFQKSSDKQEVKKENDHQEQNVPDIKRIRTFADERNQFVIHLYFPLTDYDAISNIYLDFVDRSEAVVFEQDPHMSFTRGYYAAQYHQIEPLFNQFSNVFKTFNKFSVCLSDVVIFNNHDNTRYFIAISEKENNCCNELQNKISNKSQLIKSIHCVLKQFRSEIGNLQMKEIENFLYHTSVAWFLSKDYKTGHEICDELNQYFAESALLVKVDKIIVKVGHRTMTIELDD